MTATASPYEVRIGSTDHLSTEHPSNGGARTLCGITIAGTPEGPTSHRTCPSCQQAAEEASAEQGRLEGEYGELPLAGPSDVRHLLAAVAELEQVSNRDGLAEVVARDLAHLRATLARIDSGEL